MKLAYRNDIDGLRAIAVLSVVFFHSGIDLFSGGYVGVDIFFVISGFLITSIIYREVQENNFSIARFYERRIRRIFPALFAVILFSLVFGLVFYAPEDLEKIAKSVRYTVIFFSNYLFARKTGYFDTGAEYEPLLHMWSLAVEEQYYIIFPIILLLMAKFVKQKLVLLLGVIFILSFIFSVTSVENDSHRAFFVTEGRVWELLIGSFIALNVFPSVKNKVVNNVCSIVGLILILSSIFLFTKETLFPGLSALLPTLGAAFIIYSGIEDSSDLIVNKLLSSKAMVFVGVISYSLYLWHWPLIVFAKHLLIRPMFLHETVLLLVLMGMVSFLSWKYIEQPFRKNGWFTERKKLFKVSISVMVGVFLLCMVIKATDGVAVRDTNYVDVEWEKWGDCNDYSEVNTVGGEGCELGMLGEAPSFMLWGDSHARAIAPGVNLSAEKFKKSGVISTINGCAPLLGVESKQIEECFSFNNQVMNYIEANPNLKVIILAARWAANVEGQGYGMEFLEPVKLKDTLIKGSGANSKDNELVVTRALKRTVEKLISLDRKVVLMSQVPEVGHDVESIAFIAEKTKRNVNELIAPKLESYLDRNHRVINLFRELSTKAVIVEPYLLLCDETVCEVAKEKKLLYKDDDHLSSYGARLVADVFDPVFQSKSNKANR